jgi:hypothetical protein
MKKSRKKRINKAIKQIERKRQQFLADIKRKDKNTN